MAGQPPAGESPAHQDLLREGLRPARWSNGPDAVYGVHEHPYGKVLVIESGSIVFTIHPPAKGLGWGGHGTRIVRMKRGDRLDLLPRTPHSAVVGPEGVVCLEAHVRPKTS